MENNSLIIIIIKLSRRKSSLTNTGEASYKQGANYTLTHTYIT